MIASASNGVFALYTPSKSISECSLKNKSGTIPMWVADIVFDPSVREKLRETPS